MLNLLNPRRSHVCVGVVRDVTASTATAADQIARFAVGPRCRMSRRRRFGGVVSLLSPVNFATVVICCNGIETGRLSEGSWEAVGKTQGRQIPSQRKVNENETRPSDSGKFRVDLARERENQDRTSRWLTGLFVGWKGWWQFATSVEDKRNA